MKFLALLRGVNVGGNNIIKMADLRACVMSMGLENVTTYIQSGNLLFESQIRDTEKHSRTIETALAEELLRSPQVVVVSQHQLQKVVRKTPSEFGMYPAEYRYDVVFVKPPVSALELLPMISPKQGVDEVFELNGVLYFRRLISKASQSYLPKLTAVSGYKAMTIRNWATTTKLLELMSGGSGKG